MFLLGLVMLVVQTFLFRSLRGRGGKTLFGLFDSLLQQFYKTLSYSILVLQLRSAFAGCQMKNAFFVNAICQRLLDSISLRFGKTGRVFDIPKQLNLTGCAIDVLAARPAAA